MGVVSVKIQEIWPWASGAGAEEVKWEEKAVLRFECLSRCS